MSDNTSIEWADRTWNPLLGCERVSPGCDACYAINTATIRAGNPHPKVASAFAGLTERRDGRLDWTGRINLLPDRMTQPLSWRKPSRVFVNSQSDLFHKAVPDEFIARVFAVMALTPRHTYQLLTKRHGRMRSWLNNDRMRLKVYNEAHAFAASLPSFPDASVPWPLPNLWLGVSVEDQARAELRIPALLETPAAVRWLSCEPLLGPVDLFRNSRLDRDPGLDWVVVGGESGPRPRPMEAGWARALRDACSGAGIPFFFKQWGGRSSKANGRVLDGRTWDEYPAARPEAVAR
ncbi:protein gp37 [Actinoplanes campanulatus]|uniref:Protein gp37 n=1 Tax=Actinoplanes campanulatus TaxID=113559 RepID=A0A7W5AME8_9ACTN|nr:phage Gp37/Gp68 family protein [Actinoplanes campanulatus]MBB3098958.1 protein gp37 [Actinoplanes campanulatus]GGN39688.1 hypothetical protein GCM10010109_67920 [Actinoplanes campanulatus]